MSTDDEGLLFFFPSLAGKTLTGFALFCRLSAVNPIRGYASRGAKFQEEKTRGGGLVTDCLLFTYLQSISSVTILRAGDGVHLLTRDDKDEGLETLPRAATRSLFWSTLIKKEKAAPAC